MPLSKKFEWIYKNRLINIIIENNGEIFGGTVRDKYIHDVHSLEFYKIIKDMKDSSNNIVDVDNLYDDKTFHPELFGRWVIPTDVDAFIHTSKLDNLIEKIKYKFESVHSTYCNNSTLYLQANSSIFKDVEHKKYIIIPPISKKIQTMLCCMQEPSIEKIKHLIEIAKISFYIKLDLIVYTNPGTVVQLNNKFLFGKLDFECNGLIMDNTSIKLSTHLLISHKISSGETIKYFELMMNIFNDIKNKRAVYVNQDHGGEFMRYIYYRCEKMIRKGWTIEDLFKTIDIIDESEYEGHCILCHGKLKNIMLKHKCCDARYHVSCMNKIITKNINAGKKMQNCIMCKKINRYIVQDYAMLLNYMYYAPSTSWWPSAHQVDDNVVIDDIDDAESETVANSSIAIVNNESETDSEADDIANENNELMLALRGQMD